MATNPPKPFSEDAVADRFWTPEAWDRNLPSPGFITDFILALRGIKTPTKFQLWSALWLLSSVIKRDAELEWGPLRFFFNLFVFLVGPPAVGKTASIDWADDNLLRGDLLLRFDDKLFGEKKLPRLIHSKGTAEGIFKFLLPHKKTVEIEKGRMVEMNVGSNVAILTGELATFLGRQQYNVGLIEKLTRLYDCASVDDETMKSNEAAGGQKVVRDPYVTLLGGITPDGLAQSVPESAFGDGFLSRVIVVYQDSITRAYPFPRIVMGGPTRVELQERLAWVAENAKGKFIMSKDAASAYQQWYTAWTTSMNDNPNLMRRSYARYDIHALKIAALIRANRYSPGQTIELQDWEEARRILDATLCDSALATEDVGADEVRRTMNLMEAYARRHDEGFERVKFLQCYSSQGLKASTLNLALAEFSASGRLIIWEDGHKQKKRSFPTTSGKEVYEIIPNGYEGAKEVSDANEPKRKTQTKSKTPCEDAGERAPGPQPQPGAVSRDREDGPGGEEVPIF